jgi:chemosensory pili system protein ChpE
MGSTVRLILWRLFETETALLTLIITAFGLGLVFNAAPGPVFAETVRRGVRGGFRPAFAVQIGSLTGDALWAILGLAGVGLLLQLGALRGPIGIAGISYLLWLAWDTWRASTRDLDLNFSDGVVHSHKALRSGIVLSLTNPQNIAYWAAIGSALGALGVQNPTPSHYVTFFTGFMLASVVWAVVVAVLVDWVLGKTDVGWARVTYRICAAAFLMLALLSLRELWLSSRSVVAGEAPKATSSNRSIHHLARG